MIAAKAYFAAFLMALSLATAVPAQAGSFLERAQEGGLNTIGADAYGEDGEPSKSLQSIIASLVKVLLGVLGLIFVVLLIAAGFKYMTSAGNQEKIDEAVHQIRNAVIGLIIIVCAYSITYFITVRILPNIVND
jgi:uncharacterized membrane protein